MLTVIVNGLPGAGKTTVARRLARSLKLPLFSKDAIKETIGEILVPLFNCVDSGGPDHGGGRADRDRWSRMLGMAAGETLWTLLAESGCGGIVDNVLLGPARSIVEAGLRRAGVRDVHEVWCDLPASLARERYRARDRQHPAHRDATTEEWAQWERHAAPLGLGPVHLIDTTLEVDIDELTRQIRAAHQSCLRSRS